MFPAPVHHTFGPLADGRQIRRSLGVFLTPWRWRRGTSSLEFSEELKRKFRGDLILFSSGREGLLALFRALDLHADDEVIIQAYTCVVVPNAIQAAGAVPVYVDIERDTLNLDLDDVRKKITPKTRAIICQHTFGIPADMEALRVLCDERQIVLIEDCAHVLPDEPPSPVLRDQPPPPVFRNQPPPPSPLPRRGRGYGGWGLIAQEGDYLLLSFGRDKAISGITGGAIVSRNPTVSTRLRELEKDAVDLPLARIFRYLLYPIVYWKIRLLYRFGLGRLYAAFISRLGALVPIVTREEKHGRMPEQLHRMPNACAYLALDQLRRLKSINDHRRMLTKFYLEEFQKRGWPILGAVHKDLPLQKFPIFVKEAEKIRRSLKRKNIFLDDGWTGCVVCPASVHIPDTGYELGNDPEAEAVCEEILSLPTHPGMTIGQARRLVGALEGLLS